MSSGNPFRASQAFPRPAPVPQTSFINTDSSVLEVRRGDSDHVLEDAAAPTKTKKSVRIVSPTTTIPPPPNFDDDNNVTLNELMARRASHGDRPASPPPPVNPAGFANHSITAGEANAQVIGKDALVTAGALPSTRPYLSGSQGASAPGNAPANPFSKTLASLEPQQGEGGTEERTNAQRPTPGNNRASLDVESFKNLLMTGMPTPRASGQSARPGSASYSTSSAQFESSSTDSSSVSRQSISEHPQEIHAASSRTSDDVADEDEDEGVGMMPEVKKGKKQPPPAPKHRHGKLVAPRQPQTVPFDQFEATEPVAPASISRTNSSDASKPFPSSPMSQQQSPQQSRPTPPKPSDAPKSTEDPAKPKKTPPPVPIARRQSQLKTTTSGNRSRSSSNLTISSQHSVEAPQTPTSTYHDPMSSAKSPPPPPPPSRYGARLANLGASSTNSSSTELAQSSSSARIPRSIPDAPSPRRNPLDSEAPSPAPSMHRTPSVSSTRNTQRNVSGGSTGSIMPPPPPPRRRQSNRSSLDQQRPYPYSSTSPSESRRTSTEFRRTSTEHRRTSVASESSLRRAYAPLDEKGENEHALYSPVDEKERVLGVDDSVVSVGADKGGEEVRSNSSNILDDMEKFQREIDELMGKYK